MFAKGLAAPLGLRQKPWSLATAAGFSGAPVAAGYTHIGPMVQTNAAAQQQPFIVRNAAGADHPESTYPHPRREACTPMGARLGRKMCIDASDYRQCRLLRAAASERT
jgi:hypothetical protein